MQWCKLNCKWLSKLAWPASGVDIRVPEEAEAVLAELVHEEVGLEVNVAPAQLAGADRLACLGLVLLCY